MPGQFGWRTVRDDKRSSVLVVAQDRLAARLRALLFTTPSSRFQPATEPGVILFLFEVLGLTSSRCRSTCMPPAGSSQLRFVAIFICSIRIDIQSLRQNHHGSFVPLVGGSAAWCISIVILSIKGDFQSFHDMLIPSCPS